jgi:hypothetical protein
MAEIFTSDIYQFQNPMWQSGASEADTAGLLQPPTAPSNVQSNHPHRTSIPPKYSLHRWFAQIAAELNYRFWLLEFFSLLAVIAFLAAIISLALVSNHHPINMTDSSSLFYKSPFSCGQYPSIRNENGNVGPNREWNCSTQMEVVRKAKKSSVRCQRL